ncbi:DNA internalization-related competence protein ComEC/Rec2 [Methylomonas sp. MgM2]
MYLAVSAFVVGVSLVQQWTRLPDGSEWAALIAAVLVFAQLRLRLACFFLVGVVWAGLYADWRLSDRLTDALQGRDVAVQGYVAGIPKRQGHRFGFEFVVTDAPNGVPGKLRLSWYMPPTPVRAGQSWDMTVRLKKPHGMSNPGGFDYETWLFANHIGATGYVRPEPVARMLEPQFHIGRYLAGLRQKIANGLDAAGPHTRWLGVVKALAIGSQDAISKDQWAIFRKTGTVHLMVISGTHIGLIAGLVFILARRVWTWTNVLSVSPQNVAAVMAWAAALAYTALAGFSIPTQRALIMLTVGLAAIVLQRNTAPLQVLLSALFVVVLIEPLAVLSVGFWLSFAAVGLLIYLAAGRLSRLNSWSGTAKLHTAVAVGLAPLLIVFFQQVSLIAPLANWVAVPVIGLLVTPAALSAAAVALISPVLAAELLWLIDHALEYLGLLLQKMAALPLATVSCPSPSGFALLFAIAGILLCLAPKGMPARYLSPFLLLPLIFGRADKPGPGDAWLTMLDVGQGLATVVQTANHVLVYDTGAKYSEQFDMGEAAILPFLRYRAINHIDRLMISHGENDHSGGAASLLAGLAVDEVYSSAAEWAALPNGHYCQAGQRWRWDGVDFEILSPGIKTFDSKNNNSCVLKVTGPQHAVLLTGDIEREAERALADFYGDELKSSVLLAPHHGSRTSSRGYFLDRVDPELILISAGYMNRFGFPDKRVLARYRKRECRYLTTAEQGAIAVMFDDETMRVDSWRDSRKRYWTVDD